MNGDMMPPVELKGGLSRYWWMLSPPMGRLRVSRDRLEIFSTLGDIVPPLRAERDNVLRVEFQRRLSCSRVVVVMADGTAARTRFLTFSRPHTEAVLEQFGWPVAA